LAIVVLASVPSAASADEFDRGPFEFTLAGTGSSDKDFDSTSLGVDVGLGYFLGPFEIGARQTINYTSAEEVSDFWSGVTRVFLDFQLDFGPVSPFIGANIGYIYGDLVDDQFIAGPEAGIKLHVGDDRDTFIYGRVEYQFFFEDTDDAENAFEDGQFVYTIGVGFRF
jgi:hypothetical protein